ncbi:MAG TPA: decaprenyl-phosphate phosphoribosyltransferase [Kiritimatiellia bacterium]|nr:decaprenyl-phosphate phosphoribosyltransferase [Kiritimatiellia bacterium]HRZ12765.1 decaprenyl-phosphate phosphoribosyltransferase [Kiritimatiellia bacterium]HSA18283.1 decaprenyl-phosphate phosphoribosyltransferase [Kiritimatiellia bacterium]
MSANPLWSAVRAMRPKQWTKNAVVLAAFIFALGDRQQGVAISAIWTAIGAALLFCLASSAVYLFNDVRDLPQDRLHPKKKLRPIAAGELPVPVALGMSAILLIAALQGAWLVSRDLALVIGGYVALQIVYTLALKKVALVDIFMIAGGFVLRALAGAVAIRATISPWLLLCTLLLALFLALCKRRHEKVVLSDVAGATRESMGQYDERLLDQLIAIVSAATLVCYALYTLWPDTVQKFGTAKLGLTIPFVIFGLFRYLDIVYRHEKGDRPEQILLTDVPLLADLFLYGLTVLGVLLYGRP